MFSKERRQEGGDDGKSLTPFQAISIAIGGTAGASGNTGSPLHVEDAVTIYNRLGKAIEAQMTGSDGSES